jgi:hypothetical protein
VVKFYFITLRSDIWENLINEREATVAQEPNGSWAFYLTITLNVIELSVNNLASRGANMTIQPGMVYPHEGKWKFYFFIRGEKKHSDESYLHAGQAKQAMRMKVKEVNDQEKGRW